mmetsp:Transcript_13029/g.31449  ORF Transcript_13029/g.31449 Transcript_13029/m.31449 type:complete len:204 (-) Transcript_13029:540-1151(-)
MDPTESRLGNSSTGNASVEPMSEVQPCILPGCTPSSDFLCAALSDRGVPSRSSGRQRPAAASSSCSAAMRSERESLGNAWAGLPGTVAGDRPRTSDSSCTRDLMRASRVSICASTWASSCSTRFAAIASSLCPDCSTARIWALSSSCVDCKLCRHRPNICLILASFSSDWATTFSSCSRVCTAPRRSCASASRCCTKSVKRCA